MHLCTLALLIVGLAAPILAASVVPNRDDASNAHKRVHDQVELSDEDHFDDDDDHNYDYDHEAFLGKEHARDFEDLTPEESKERLGQIYDKIDTDGDKLVSNEELQHWIQKVQNRYTVEDTERQWADQDPDHEGRLVWESYKKRTYGYLEEEEDYKEMLDRDQRRWKKADKNGDELLDKEEFASFLHPEDVPHMRDIVIDETMEDIDRNKDGVISLEEYIEDMWPSHMEDADEEPEWVKTERDQFAMFRDKNKDAVMDRAEVEDWILPPDYDHTEAESRHLIQESDLNGDKLLSKEEVLNKYDLFVGSQATDFGEALTRHDEF